MSWKSPTVCFSHLYWPLHNVHSSSTTNSHKHDGTLGWAFINATWQWRLSVGVCDCLCRKAWSMCVNYRSCNVQQVSSSVIALCVWVTVCVCVSLFTSVLFHHALSCIFFLLRMQVSFCLFHLFFPHFLLSITLPLYMKQGHSAPGEIWLII